MPQARNHITRRSMLAAFALPVIPALSSVPALPAPALPAPAPTPDPIFAAMAAHTRAFRAFTAVLDALAVAEQEAWHAPRGQRRAAGKRLKQARAAESHFGNLESDAFAGLVATVPQTLAGAAAMLAYVSEWLAEGHSLYDEDETITLLTSVEQVVCKAAGLPSPSCPGRSAA